MRYCVKTSNCKCILHTNVLYVFFKQLASNVYILYIIVKGTKLSWETKTI